MSSLSSFSSSQANIAVKTFYENLIAVSGGVNQAHALSNETLFPGVYDVSGAMSLAGILTLDGLGDPNSLFIIRSTGAITTAVNTRVNLINQAHANNVFWLAEGIISTGDPAIIKGTFISNHAAVALGANTAMEGRIFAVNGALTMGANSSLTAPTGSSEIDLGILSSFAMYSAYGAVSTCADCSVIGDVGTGLGLISDFGNVVGTIYPAGAEASVPAITTYSIYQNNKEVLHSKRIIHISNAVVSLQALVTVNTEDEIIEIRWKVDSGTSVTGSRTLSLLRSRK
jgi:hypothetical protein